MSLFHAGLQPAIDSNGDPISGATWNFYATGTTTPVAVYADSDLSTSLGAVVTANSVGRFADIYLDDVIYRAILKDAGGSNLADIDPVSEPIDATTIMFLQSGTGAVERTAQSKMRDVVSVKDFGAVGDGVTDDTAAFQATIAAVADGGTVIIHPGTYKLSTELAVASRSNITFRGDNATLKGGATRFRSYFYITGSTNIAFDGISFDQLQPSLPTYSSGDYSNIYNCPIYASTTSGLSVANCTFVNLYTSSIYFYQSSNMVVDKCVFTSPVQSQDQWLQFVHLQTYGGSNHITRCRFENAATTNSARNPAALFASGGAATSSLSVIGNRADYCGRDNTGTHRLAVFDIYGDAQNIVVEANTCANTMSQFMRLSACRGARVHNNRVAISASAEFDYSILTIESTIAFSPGQVGVQDVVISQNVFEDPSNRAAFAVGALSYDWGAPSTGIRILNNQFTGARRSVVVQGPFNDVQIVGNHSRSGGGRIEVGHSGTNAANVTATFGTEANSRFDNLFIANNVTVNDSGSDSNGVDINLNKTPTYTGTLGLFAIRNNSFRKSGSADSGQAISVILNALTLQGRLTLEGNETNNFTYDWYIRSTQEVVIRNNRALATATSALLEDGSNGSILREGNRLSTGAIQGSATLVAGTVTVSTAEIRTGDIVTLSRQSTGGTLGDLSVGTITNATSFVINSNNAADTSVVFWRIEH